MAVSRRQFFGGAGLAIAFAGGLDAVFQAPASATDGYGPLIPDPMGVLDLPKGFSYTAFSAAGEEIAPGVKMPGLHDGMATFRGPRDHVRLVRNHEQGTSGVKPVADPRIVYDPAAWGGTSTLEVDRRGSLVSHRISLAGTVRNCAGGRTPWGTWLTCEETEGIAGQTKSHGWVFEVDPAGRHADAVPLTSLGRYAHEAVAIDPATHAAYLTEDAGGPAGLFYRFRPNTNGWGYGFYRRSGTLEAMHVPDVSDLSAIQEPGTTFHHVRWAKVPDPSAATVPTRKQFEVITRGQKLEGCEWRSGSVFFVSSFSRTSEGSAADHAGQVWRYWPRRNVLRLELIFKPGGKFDAPDNITISPYGGGLVLAEDGEGEQYLVGVNRRREAFPIARNAFNDGEFAGATFSASGRTLYANRQSPGLTFAITGPWR